jgi:hypothetical protein
MQLINIEDTNIFLLSSLSEMYPDTKVKSPYTTAFEVANRPISNGDAESDKASIGTVIPSMSMSDS